MKRVAVVTGSRADYGLLRPVMRAVQRHAELELHVIACGGHLIAPELTIHDVREDFTVNAAVRMQAGKAHDRVADVAAVGAGVSGFGDVFASIEPHWVVVLGDRIEAFAAATAASIGGFPLAHIHGGDRAEGVADEAMRHAITKLAHLHLPATHGSGERIAKMGEDPDTIIVVGSPAIDELAQMPALDDEHLSELGTPKTLFLMHPIGRSDQEERDAAAPVLDAIDEPALALMPNHDAGRNGIVQAIEDRGIQTAEHLPRRTFIGLLRRIDILVGNSSCGLIEAAAIGRPVVDIGMRQHGRERGWNVVTCEQPTVSAVRDAIQRAHNLSPGEHPYGDGKTGQRIAQLLAERSATVRKCNSY